LSSTRKRIEKKNMSDIRQWGTTFLLNGIWQITAITILASPLVPAAAGGAAPPRKKGWQYDGGYQEYRVAPVEALGQMPESLDAAGSAMLQKSEPDWYENEDGKARAARSTHCDPLLPPETWTATSEVGPRVGVAGRYCAR
jgi:hypothetical protein